MKIIQNTGNQRKLMNNPQMDISNRYMPVALQYLEQNIYTNPDIICTVHTNNAEDIDQHIDLSISLNNKNHTWQIKTITDMEYNDFTIEYMNNRFTNEWGEIQDIWAKYYFHARVSYGKIWKVGIINVNKFMHAFNNNKFKYTIKDNPDSNASFLCVSWDILNALDGVVVHYYSDIDGYNKAQQTKINAMIKEIQMEIDNER